MLTARVQPSASQLTLYTDGLMKKKFVKFLNAIMLGYILLSLCIFIQYVGLLPEKESLIYANWCTLIWLSKMWSFNILKKKKLNLHICLWTYEKILLQSWEDILFHDHFEEIMLTCSFPHRSTKLRRRSIRIWKASSVPFP